jgi:hypothetical protein
MKKLSLFISILSVILIALSCEGPQGIEGPKGADGIANVNSAIFDVESNRWLGDTNGYTATLIIPEIDNEIYNNGAVLVYMLTNEQSSDKSFNKLPYTYIDNSFIEYMDYNVYIGTIDITIRQAENNVNNTQAPGALIAFKVIIIEGTSLSALQTKVDLNNYYAVVTYSKNISNHY